jgi:hypothetical protein
VPSSSSSARVWLVGCIAVGIRRSRGRLVSGTIAIYVLALAIVHDLIQLPLAFYEGVTLERRYGLSTESTGRWWKDHLKGWAIGTAFGSSRRWESGA